MKKASLILLLFTPFIPGSVYSQSYTVDAGHTAITSKVMRFGVIPVLGRFNDVSGSISYNPGSPENTSATITIKTGSYVANNVDGEEAVMSDAFLNVASHPEMIFEVTKLVGKGEGLMATGTLTLHGTTKEVSIPVSITGPMMDLPTRKQSIGIVGSLTINRLDYGVGQEMKLPTGLEIIGNDVVIEFYVLALAD
ncbi:MAG: polyisoprenoid-binding protein [Balneola sp.]|nr:MAG: polyisoprenoid-binding protein [Balneola sp.]